MQRFRIIKTVWLVLLASLILRLIFFNLGEKKIVYREGELVSFEGRLESEPKVFGGRQTIVLGELRVVTTTKRFYHYGDRLWVRGQVSCLLSKARSGCSAVLKDPQIDFVLSQQSNLWLALAGSIRNSFQDTYLTLLPREEADLLSGVVLGRVGLARTFQDKMANVGLSHIIAASGMNVTMVATFFIWIFSGLRISKMLNVGLVMVFILFYCSITGFEASVVRAAVMVIFSFAGILVGRQTVGWAGLVWAAFLMLWVDPKLLDNFGFLLSFASMAGQLTLVRQGSSLPNLLRPVIENFSQTVAAILFTFPIIIIGFAHFSLVAVFTNLLVVWTVEPLMILGGLAGLAGTVSLDFARVFTRPASVLLDYFLWVANFFNQPEFVLSLPRPGWIFAIGYYFVLGVGLYWWRARKAVNAQGIFDEKNI